jgi:hypothetical protein
VVLVLLTCFFFISNSFLTSLLFQTPSEYSDLFSKQKTTKAKEVMVGKYQERKAKKKADEKARRASNSSVSSALSMMMIASVVAPKRKSDEKNEPDVPAKCPKEDASTAGCSTPSNRGRPRKQERNASGRFARSPSAASMASRSRSSSVASRNSSISLGLTSNAGSVNEEQQRNEAIARMLNDAQFKVPEVPLRRSVRSTQGKTPDRFSENESRIRDTGIKPVTPTCRLYKHKGYGCASLEAEHYPEYYDSCKNVSLIIITTISEFYLF